MAKRKKKITVATVKSAVPQREAEMRATPERLRHAVDSRVGTDKVQRITASHLEWYAAHGKLSTNSRDNMILMDAARKLEKAWHASGLTGVSGMDLTRQSGGGDNSPSWGMPTSEYAFANREVVRHARNALVTKIGTMYSGIVFAVVIDGEKIEDVAPVDHTSHATRVSFGLEFLRVGLRVLAQHWGMMPTQPA